MVDQLAVLQLLGRRQKTAVEANPVTQGIAVFIRCGLYENTAAVVVCDLIVRLGNLLCIQ